MSDLSAFLKENSINAENIKVVISDRFKSNTGKAIEWELRPIDCNEDENLRKRCTKKIIGSNGITKIETDYDLYLSKLAAACVVYPNLKSEELQNSYGVMGDDVLIKTMLYPGEFSNLMKTIQTLNGFDVSIEDKVAEAKN